MSAEPTTYRSPVAELRALKRAGLGGSADRARALLAELVAAGDPLDLEAAGSLLSGRVQREQLAAAGGFADYRLALLGSSTLDALAPLLTAHLVGAGVLPEIRSTGFNQWRFEILAGAPTLKDLRPQLSALLLDEAAVFEGVAQRLDLTEIEQRCAAFPGEIEQWLTAARQALGGLVVLATVPLGALTRGRFVDYRGKARLAAAWQRMNAELLALAERHEALVVLDLAEPAERAGQLFATDRMRHVAGQVYAARFLAEYAGELAKVVRAALGRAAKCLVLDLDNTLWGGVVGDDSVAGLKLGGAFPGSAHRELQVLAKDFMAQGVMLAVASKNEEVIAREAVATHPEMALAQADFVAFAANWNPKPDNLAKMAEQLNIGVDAMVFVDDNPVERGLMREVLPQVATVELPGDPAGYAVTLAGRGDFNVLSLTAEDRDRTELYRSRAARAELAGAASSLTDYLESLDSELTVEAVNPLNAVRIAQLFGKTNQFNLTGVRYGLDEVEAGVSDFFAARLTDRFGDNGLIAALALGRDAEGARTVENFVLSCRVFSREVEDAILGLVLRAAVAEGAPAVLASYTRTAKNGQFAGFYTAAGFTETAPGVFRHDLRELSDLPRWIRINEPEEAFRVS
ncbi:HAD-IIIC family phosphatase [Kitasatospora sp. NBC_01287]|uniref:HAD-IIIC family phosphatase n=1 Tax=Kitasatospora sp. NBC_01287 TaxID=2903573 RepID=UPI0022532E81|nr:HAD-IIIC family phosphatase [Kitasatospora sp. NBC_01287]MCX4748866.1 HAD-IIIC family phosphatase [Kitasatospora sp. NBC_01287]